VEEEASILHKVCSCYSHPPQFLVFDIVSHL
jgi:hypothetical protein